MFKKRTIKPSASSAAVSKRKIALDSESDSESAPKVSEKSNTSRIPNDFKKRKTFTGATSRKPNKEVTHIRDDNEYNISENNTDESASDTAKLKTVGYIKPVPKNIKITTITDFQPDVCKDFLQTGYCGYGDTCKFLHIRNELTRTKPIDKEWETVDDGNKPAEETLPFKCVLCKDDYKSPIKTQCGHLYCKKCFMDRYKKKKLKCFICDKETNGIVVPVLESALKKMLE